VLRTLHDQEGGRDFGQRTRPLLGGRRRGRVGAALCPLRAFAKRHQHTRGFARDVAHRGRVEIDPDRQALALALQPQLAASYDE
jgi:hypothetical protein